MREATEVATALVHEGPGAVTSSTNASLLSTVMLPNAIVASFEGRHEDAARLMGGWERLEREFLVRFPDVAIAQFGDPAARGSGSTGRRSLRARVRLRVRTGQRGTHGAGESGGRPHRTQRPEALIRWAAAACSCL